MSASRIHAAPAAPARLALYVPPADEPADRPPPLDAGCTLRELYERWYLPVVLVGQRDASRSTQTLYRDALGWWELLTGRPPLAAIDDAVWSAYLIGLREARFRRGPTGPERKLAPATRRKHQVAIRAVLLAAGPRRPGRPGLRLLPELPDLPVERSPEAEPHPLTLAEARRVYALALAAPPAHQWPERILLLYHTGLRLSDAWGLGREHLVCEDGLWIVESPPARKTGKRSRIALPAAIGQRWAARGPGPLVDAEAACGRYLATLHQRLLAAADVRAGRCLHSWRATHAQQLALLGLAAAESVARSALLHSSIATTRAHYCDPANLVRPAMPLLWEAEETRSAER